MITQIWRFGEFLNQSFSLSCWQSSWWWPSPFGQPSMSNSYRAHRRTAIAYNVPVSMSNACAINLKMVIFYFLNKFTRERKKSNIKRTITHFITYSLNNRTDSMFWLSPNKSFFFLVFFFLSSPPNCTYIRNAHHNILLSSSSQICFWNVLAQRLFRYTQRFNWYPHPSNRCRCTILIAPSRRSHRIYS